MCNFKSCIVLKNGDILHDDYTDSHEDLINYYGLSDGGEPSINRFVRVEYAPEDIKDYANIKKYILKVDESQTPAWFEEIKETVEGKIQAIVKRMILKDVDKKCLLSGCYILAGKTKLEYIRNTRIIAVCGSAQIENVCDSAQIKYVCGSAQIENVCGSAQIKYVYGSAQIENVYGSAQIVLIEMQAKVLSIKDKAKIITDKRVAVS